MLEVKVVSNEVKLMVWEHNGGMVDSGGGIVGVRVQIERERKRISGRERCRERTMSCNEILGFNLEYILSGFLKKIYKL